MKEIILGVAEDWQFKTALLLVVADFLFGVLAAFKTNTFSLSRVADTLKDDLLWKVVPYASLAILAEIAANQDIIIPGLDFSVLADAAWGILILAMVPSLLSSLSELGLPGANKVPTSQ